MVLLNAQNAHCSAVAWERTVQAVGDSVLFQIFMGNPNPQKMCGTPAVADATPHKSL
jgi:hypothetical protein